MRKGKKGGEVTRPLQPAWLVRTEWQAVTSKVRRSGIDRVTRRVPVVPLTAISRMARTNA